MSDQPLAPNQPTPRPGRPFTRRRVLTLGVAGLAVAGAGAAGVDLLTRSPTSAAT